MSAWGFTWGAPWGATTEWNTRADPRDDASPLLAQQPGDLDVLQTAIARLRRQFSGASSWQAMAGVIGESFADIEGALRRLDTQRTVDTATGVWLAELGAEVGLPREGWTSDDDYRLAVVAEALSRITSGTADEIVDVALRLLPDGAVLQYRERYPAAFELAAPDLPAGRFALLLQVLADMPAAGVGAFLTTWSEALTGGLSFSSSVPEVFGAFVYGTGTDDADVLSLFSYSHQIGT